MSKSSDDTTIDIDATMERLIALLTEAKELSNAGKYEEAIDNYNKILNTCETADTHICIGDDLNHLGRYEEALVALNRAIELEPDDSLAHNNRGNSLKHLGMQAEDPKEAQDFYKEAIAAYDRAIALEPNHAGYICNKGKVLQIIGDERGALDCFNQAFKAYELIKSGALQAQTPITAAFVEHTLSHDREELLKKVIDLQEAALDMEELVGENGSEETKAEIATLKHAREGVVSEFLSGMGGSDTGASTSSENAELVARLNMVMAQYEALRAKVESHDTAIAVHDVAIMDIKEKIASLELRHKEMNAMVKAFHKKGIKDTDTVLSFLADLKATITGTTPEHIAQDPYANAFYNSLQRDLNANYIAAMSVQTDIVENSKKSMILGNVASILNIAGQFIPTIGGGVLFLGAVLGAVDQKDQDLVVKRFAEIAANPMQMGMIASNIANILTQDAFTSSLCIDDSSLGEKLGSYLISFFQGVSGGTTKSAKAAASNAAIDLMQKMGVSVAESAITKTPTKSKFSAFSIFKKKAAAADQEQEEIKTSHSTEKSQGEKDAHMVSAIIISKIYRGEISAYGTPDNVAKAMAHAVLEQLAWDHTAIDALISHDHAEADFAALLVGDHSHDYDVAQVMGDQGAEEYAT